MLLEKITGSNYLVKLMLLLAATFVLVLAVFLLVTSFPEALGTPPPSWQIIKSYKFEPWSFSFHGLYITYPEGGTIVPIYEQEKQKAAIILGRGVYVNQNSSATMKTPGIERNSNASGDPEHPPGNLEAEPAAGIYLIISEEELEDIKGDIIFIPMEEPAAHVAINALLARQLGLPVIWSGKIPFVYPPSRPEGYYYFIDRRGNPVLPPVLTQASGNVYISGLLNIMFCLIICLAVLILSLDYPSSRCRKEGQNTVSGRWETAAIFLAGAMAFGGEILPGSACLPEPMLAVGYGAAILLLFALFWTGKTDFPELGVNRDTFGRGYFMAIVAAVLLLTTILKLPQGIRVQGWQPLVILMISFFCMGLPREIIWRGFIQNALGKRIGLTGGLLATILLAGVIRGGVYLITARWMLFYPFTWVEIAVLEPGLAAILGFLNIRTENVLSCALLHTLVIVLPQLLVF